MKYITTVLLLSLSIFALVNGDPSACYHCTLLDFDKCTSPLNPDDIGTQSCDDIDTLGHQNTTSKTVCYTVTATWIGLHIAERGCYYAEMDGKDLCTFFNETQANEPLTYDYTCNICDGDYCNKD